MADRFIEQSKEIANNFIQNIVFIDDKAYKNDMTNNAFSALDVSNVFAQSGKICAVYAPKSISDVNSYNTILNKADVVILDWYLDIEKEENQVEDPDADADNDDPRGEFTLKLISDLLSQTGMLKLLIVYTGETDLFEITNSIYQKVDQHSFHKGDCVIQSLNSKILVRAKKQNSETQFAHNPELKDKIVSYESLPTLIVEEFADMTNGLLSNFALSSISAIRNNTSRMLSVFSPKLDPAYLGHKILLENTFESKQLLIKLFGEAISELLETTDIDTKDWVDNWIENRITDETISINGVSIGKSKDLLKKMFSSEQPRLKDKYTEASGKDMSNKDEGKLQSHTIELFAYDGIDVNKSNVDFAILTHHKNIFQPAIGAPILTLGTVIKSVDKYYVCKYSINSLVYWVTYVHNVVYSFYRSMIYCYINSTQRCAGSIVIDIIPTNGADKRKFFPFAPYFPVTNVIKRYFYPYFPAIIGIKGYSFPYFPYLSGIMKIKTALYSLFSRLDWHKTVVFPCLGEIYEGIRSLSWEIPVT